MANKNIEKGEASKIGVMEPARKSGYAEPGTMVNPDVDLKTRSDGSEESWKGPTSGPKPKGKFPNGLHSTELEEVAPGWVGQHSHTKKGDEYQGDNP